MNIEKKVSPLLMVLHIVRGAVIGIAQIIPGVSGGTLALIMGIYEKFITSLNDISRWFVSLLTWGLKGFKKEAWRNSVERFKSIDWLFVVLLFVGMLLAIVVTSGIITYFLEKFPAQTYGLFFGLIIASVIVPWGKMEKRGVTELLAMLVGFIFLFWFSGLAAFSGAGAPSLLFIFIGGMISISAMILPGLSGSFVLLVLGLYTYIIGLVNALKGGGLEMAILLPIIIFCAGMGIGLFSFAKLLDFLLKRYHSVTMAFLVGLMFGSLRKIYPFMETTAVVKKGEHLPKILPWEMSSSYLSSGQFWGVIFFIFLGAALVLSLHFISNRQK